MRPRPIHQLDRARHHWRTERRRICDELPGVLRFRRLQHPLARALLLHLAAAHDDDVLGAFRSNREIMRDEEHPGAGLLAKRVNEVEHGALHGDVERGGRFVGDDELRIVRDRRGDEHTLPHAARELVRILFGPAHRIIYADMVEQLMHARANLGAVAHAVDLKRLSDAPPDRRDRVQGVARILRNECDAAPAQPAPAPLGKPHKLGEARAAFVERDASPRDAAVAGEQPDDRLGDGTLARAGFADERRGLPRLDVEAHPAHRINGSAVRGVLHCEIRDAQ